MLTSERRSIEFVLRPRNGPLRNQRYTPWAVFWQEHGWYDPDPKFGDGMLWMGSKSGASARVCLTMGH